MAIVTRGTPLKPHVIELSGSNAANQVAKITIQGRPEISQHVKLTIGGESASIRTETLLKAVLTLHSGFKLL